jgi:hypothetical protein
VRQRPDVLGRAMHLHASVVRNDQRLLQREHVLCRHGALSLRTGRRRVPELQRFGR